MQGFKRKSAAEGTVSYPTWTRRWVIIGCGLVLSSCIGLPAYTQTSKPEPIRHLVDVGVLFPPSQQLPTVRQDATALGMIRSYQKVVGTAAWIGMEATGKVIPNAPLGTEIVPQDATLWILGHRGYRLDIQSPKGTISIRTDGTVGAMQRPDGQITLIDARDAATGLVAFPQLQSAAFPDGSTSLIDQGTVAVDGVTLRRITVEAPWATSNVKNQSQSSLGITDLYFDPATHLLMKSANTLQGTDPRLMHYVKVVSYQDYRSVGIAQIPFRISESLNGQRVWTLHLNNVAFNQQIKATSFRF